MTATPIRPNVALGARVKELRLKRGMSLRQFAAKAGVSKDLIFRLENGRQIRSDALTALARTYRLGLSH